MAAFAEMGVAPALISAIEDQGWQCVLRLKLCCQIDKICPTLQATPIDKSILAIQSNRAGRVSNTQVGLEGVQVTAYLKLTQRRLIVHRLPTPIQTEAIPLILGGGDVMAAAETGSGKTGAFALPVLQIVHETIASRHRSSSR